MSKDSRALSRSFGAGTARGFFLLQAYHQPHQIAVGEPRKRSGHCGAVRNPKVLVTPSQMAHPSRYQKAGGAFYMPGKHFHKKIFEDAVVFPVLMGI
jgi:hypothetical protein